MADSIVRLKVESQEYDAKLKRAAEGLTRYADECRKVGGTLEVVEKDTLDYVKSLGQMDTVSRTATGKLAEMKKAFTELSVQYKQLTDEEKQSPFGQALASSLDQLKSRCNEAKKQLDSVNSELGNTKTAEVDAKSGIEGLTSALGINLKSLVGWGAALGAAKGALDVAKDAFFASEQNLDDWNRTVYSAESVYQGFLTALNTGDISGFLDNINTIVKAASEAYNALDRLGTMKTIDTPQLTAKQSEIQRMQTMLRSGRWIDRADGVKSALGYKTGDILPKEVLDNIAQQLKSAMNEVAGIMKQELGAANTAIDALYKEQAVQLGMSNEQFRKGTASMAVFEENLKKAQKYLDFEREHTTSVTSTTSAGIAYTANVRDNVANPYEQYKNWNVFKDDGELYQRIVQEIRNRGAAETQYYSQVGQAYRGINRVEGVKVGPKGGTGTSPQEQAQKQVEAALLAYNQTIEKANMALESGRIDDAEVKKRTLAAQEQLWTAYGKAYATYADPKYKEAQDAAAAEIVKLGGEVKTATEAQKAAEQAAREQEAAAKKLADAQSNLADALESGDLKQIYAAQKGVENAQQGVVRSGGTVGETPGAVEVPVGIKYTTGNMEAFTQKLKQDLANADVGSLDAQKLLGQLNDATTLGNIMTYAIQQGMDMAQLGEVGQQLWKRIFSEGADIEPEDFKAMLQSIANSTGKNLTLSSTGAVTEQKDSGVKELVDGMNKTTSGLSSVSNGLKQLGVEIPKEVDELLNVMNAISSIISGVQQIISVFQVSAITANTAAVTANTIALGVNSGSNVAAGAGMAGAAAGAGIGAMGGGLIGAAIGAGVGFLAAKLFSGGGIVHAANGFVVPGNSFSGDNVPALLNSGEVVLNHSQVNNLAAELSGGRQIAPSQPYVTGETIFLGLQNYLMENGYGQLVTSRQ